MGIYCSNLKKTVKDFDNFDSLGTALFVLVDLTNEKNFNLCFSKFNCSNKIDFNDFINLPFYTDKELKDLRTDLKSCLLIDQTFKQRFYEVRVERHFVSNTVSQVLNVSSSSSSSF